MLFFSLIVSMCQAETNLTIGIDITNVESLTFLGNLEKHYDSFAEKGLNLNIQYHILPCYTCESRHNYSQSEPNCYGGGRYCSYSSQVSGQLLLSEVIRQQCIFRENKSLYLTYMNFFGKECLDNPHYTFCSQNILTNYLKVDIESIEKCISDSFEGEGDQRLKLNTQLQQEKDKQYNQSKLTVYLDNMDVTKNSFTNFITLLCDKFSRDPPTYCNILIEIESSTTIKLEEEVITYCFLILLCVLLMIALGFLHNHKSSLSNSISIPTEEKMHIIQDEQT